MEGESIYKQQQQQQPTDSNSQGKAEINIEPNQKCPRCDSVNTRFCYFNNHKTSQPRYICKNCKRFWTQGGNVRNIRSTAMSQPPPPPLMTIESAGRNVRRVGTLNFTRPQPVANEPQLIFVTVDINSLSLAQANNRVLNPYMASPQAQGQGYPVQPNVLNHQASYGQGFAAHQKPNNNLSVPGNILWDWESSNQIGHSRGGGLSGSSSSA